MVITNYRSYCFIKNIFKKLYYADNQLEKLLLYKEYLKKLYHTDKSKIFYKILFVIKVISVNGYNRLKIVKIVDFFSIGKF